MVKNFKYAVVYTTNTGAKAVLNVFKTKADAEKQVKSAKSSPSFKKLGYSNPRVTLNKF